MQFWKESQVKVRSVKLSCFPIPTFVEEQKIVVAPRPFAEQVSLFYEWFIYPGTVYVILRQNIAEVALFFKFFPVFLL